MKATLNNSVAGDGSIVASKSRTVLHLNKAGLYTGKGAVQSQNGAAITFDVANAISGTGSIVAQTGGAINIPNANSGFSGTVAIQGVSMDLASGGGKLFVNNTSGSATRTATVNLSTGTLGGNGSIGGFVNLTSSPNGASHLAPGNNGPGKLSVGSLAISSAGCTTCNVDIEIGGTTPGLTYDQIQVAGNFTMNSPATSTGRLNVSLVKIGYTRPAIDTTFTVITAASRTGFGFAQLSFPNNDSANWSVAYTANSVLVNVLGSGDFNHDNVVDGAACRLAQGIQPATVAARVATTRGGRTLAKSLGRVAALVWPMKDA